MADDDDIEFPAAKTLPLTNEEWRLSSGGSQEEHAHLATLSDGGIRPFAVSLDEFLAKEHKTPPALLGDDSEPLLPTHGLMFTFAKGGKGKTTMTVEAALHLASGIDWLGFKVPRPLRVLLIENEGPEQAFQNKLKLKRATWPHEIKGAVFVYDLDWATFTLADDKYVELLRTFIVENEIDVVIGDPLDTLGMEGVGSPEDTRNFVKLLVKAGLNRTVAFWLLHHAKKESVQDEIDAISGAWGGKPDAMLALEKKEGNRARLSFPKYRWSRSGQHPALVLAFDPETESFTAVDEEEDEERDYVAEIETLLLDGKWRTSKEIAAKADGGIGANLDTVKKALDTNSDRFTSRTGDAAKEVDRSPRAIVWQLIESD